MSNWYDCPVYYDLAFRSETALEADFIEAACRKYCSFRVRRLLEPACGTGRLVAELAKRGYRMSGFDLSEAALEFCRRRLKRKKLQGEIFAADMADFRLRRAPAAKGTGPCFRATISRQNTSSHRKMDQSPDFEGGGGGREKVDAAYNTFDSFRHLLTEESARSHLECVARCVKQGGIYILGFHLLPPDASEECIERWTEREGGRQVTVTLRVLATDRRKRVETIRISLLVRNRGKTERLRDEFRLRMYTAGQFRRLLGKTPEWELCDVYDFWYEIDRPMVLDDEMSDTVFILRRR